ncbi:hypothetical protein KDX24_26595 [Pseudomonas sp. CDFA 550]|uniref:hypothetical protein n=1 Tax=Xanthomonas hydrangeae TaxID=2775159 RepID=UPI0035181792|nr:hypothetical protein [Pseudomonas quasicaspiana]
MIKTIFLCQYLHAEPLRREINADLLQRPVRSGTHAMAAGNEGRNFLGFQLTSPTWTMRLMRPASGSFPRHCLSCWNGARLIPRGC